MSLRILVRFVNCWATIYNSQVVEAIEVFVDRWMDKQNVLHTYDGILALKRKKVLTHATNINETWEYYVNWNKSKTNIISYHLYMESEKCSKWTFYKTEVDLTVLENKLMVTKGNNWEW